MTINFNLALVAILGMLAMPSAATELPATALLSIGFTEVRLNDLQNTDTYSQRAAKVGGYLSVSADLNGDGKIHEVRILQNRDRQIAYVVAVISSPEKLDTFVLSSFALSEIAHIAIDAVQPIPELTGGHMRTGIAIFDLRTGMGEATFFDGEEFTIHTAIDRPRSQAGGV